MSLKINLNAYFKNPEIVLQQCEDTTSLMRIFNRGAQEFEKSDEIKMYAYREILGDYQLSSVTFFLFEYFILNEDERDQLLSLLISKYPEEVAQRFKMQQIPNSLKRFELAKQIAHSNAYVALTYMDHFDLPNDLSFKLAELITEKKPSAVAYCFNDFDHFNEDQRFTLTKMIIDSAPYCVARNLGKFQTFSPKKNAQIALLTAEKATESLAENFKECKVTNKKARHQIISIIIGKDAWTAVRKFKNFEIPEENDRYFFARQIIEKDPTTCYYFEEFELNEESNRFQLALLAGGKSPTTTAQRCLNFDLLQEKNRYALAIAILEKDPSTLAHHIEHFKLNEGLRFEIFKKIAQKDVKIAAHYFYKRRLFDKKSYFHIAYHITQHFESFYSIQQCGTFKMLENDDKARLWVKAFCCQPKEALSKLTFSTKSIVPPSAVGVLEKAQEYKKHSLFQDCCKKASLISSERDLLNRNQWMKETFLRYLSLTALHNEQGEHLQLLIARLYSLPTPDLREQMSSQLFTALSDPVVWNLWKKYPNKFSTKMAIPFYFGDKLLHGASQSWIEELNVLAPLFIDGKNMAVLLNFLLTLDKSDLTDAEKAHLLTTQTFYPKPARLMKGCSRSPQEKKHYYNRLRLLTTLIVAGKGKSLVQGPVSTQDLQSTCKDLFSEVFGIDPLKIQNFKKGFQHHISTMRDPWAIFSYRAQFNTMATEQSEPLIPAMSSFVLELLNGNFHEWRYDTPHLNHIKSVEPSLMEKWKKGSESSLGISSQQQANLPFGEQFKTFLYQKLITDKHIDHLENLYPTLHRFLITGEKGNNPSEPEKQLIYLCQVKENQNIDFLMTLLPEKGVEQLKNDLKEFQQMIDNAKFQRSYVGWTFKDTDDVSDLILICRETGGCLNIDTGCNKHAALANLADGKIRMLAIKNEKGETVARHLLRLMVDDNHEPVLLLERYYSLVQDTSLNRALMAFAKERAKQLGVTLVAKEIHSKVKYNGSIHSLGTHRDAIFEYSDASISGITNGIYSISGLYVHYQPPVIKPFRKNDLIFCSKSPLHNSGQIE